MGCDGGSIPKRVEMVKTKKAAEKPDFNSQLLAKYTLCSISKLPLTTPIVGCYMGKLYNKDAVLELLIDRDSFGDADILCPHIKSLKDVVNLKVEANPSFLVTKQSSILSSYNDSETKYPFICPITQKEMNGHSKFIFLSKCGCVMSITALKTVNVPTCLVCNKDYSSDDIIVINPTSNEDMRIATERITLRASKHKGKKRKNEVQSEEPKEKKKKPLINMQMPDLSSVTTAATKVSSAVSKLYQKNDNIKETWMTKGTFNRYAA